MHVLETQLCLHHLLCSEVWEDDSLGNEVFSRITPDPKEYDALPYFRILAGKLV